ncbi:MAG: hypothetical protein LUE96_05595 [Lachnospiraceae bacterium]|nr:hypothetical protein [Lachnospiraceae bacterium]
MPEANNEAQCFYQNLIDIGFGEEMSSHCVTLQKEGRRKELLIALKNRRQDLLRHIHEEQKKLDCLDYLVCQVEKNGQCK